MNKLLTSFLTALTFTVSHQSFAAEQSKDKSSSNTIISVNAVDAKLPCGSIQGSFPTIINSDLQKSFMTKLNGVMKKNGLFQPIVQEDLGSTNSASLCKQVDLQKGQVLTVNPDTRVLQVSDDFVSIRVNIPFNFMPSAHPSESGFFFNFNPKTGKVIDALDGLSAKDQEHLINQVVKELKSRGIDGSASSAKGKTLKDKVKNLLPGHVGFTTSEIVFVFWRYEIAAGADGNQVVRLPFYRSVSTSG